MITVYKASAGSGKTFNLAREYIKLVLGSKGSDGRYRLRPRGSRPLHDRVLAITFTNKATEEMKRRIIHELAVIAGVEPGWDKPSDYQDELCREFGCSPERLGETAAEALRDLLNDFNRFNVSTIDSFFQMVLRSFAHEAEVTGSYDVELDDRNVIALSIDTMLQDLNRPHRSSKVSSKSMRLIDWLTRFMTKLIEEGASFNLFNRSSQVHNDLIDFIKDITDDTYREHEKEILEDLSDTGCFKDFSAAIEEASLRAKEATKKKCLKALEVLSGIDPVGKCSDIVKIKIIESLENWSLSGYYTVKGVGTISKLSLKAIEDRDEIYKKEGKKDPRRNLIDDAVWGALHSMQECLTTMSTLKVITQNMYQMGLLSSVNEYLDRFRLENSTILLSDTNSIINKVIGDSSSPFLYEKIGTRFHNYLIDEFQDTSLSQWKNLSPLVEESLAHGNDNLVIGDEKQCIYRFRGSDPSLLHDMPLRYAPSLVRIKGNTLADNTNWRSTPEVVRFNNTLFTSLSRGSGLESIYADVAQMISPKHAGKKGYVRVNFFEAGNDSKEADQLALDNLTTHLSRQLKSGYRPGDIAILVKTWREGEAVINHLETVKKENPDFPPFDIVSDKSLLISRSPAVMLIVSRLRYLSSIEFRPRHHKKSRREVARLLNDFEEEMARMGDATGSLLTALAKMERRNSQESGDGMITPPARGEDENMTGLDLVSLVETIIATIVPESNRLKEGVFITAFQDMVSDFVTKGRADIRSFLEWWDEKGASISVAGADDPRAIAILTIHKSKGLQFPCVHVPFAGFTTNRRAVDRAWFARPEIPGIPPEMIPRFMPLNVTKAMEATSFAPQYQRVQIEKQLDLVNQLYVAFTRAEAELIVGVKIRGGSKEDRLPTIAEMITEGMRTATPEYCRTLEERADLPSDTPTPYAALDSIVDNCFELGSPTVKPAVEKSGRTSAMDPAEGTKTSVYRVGTDTSPWAHTRLSDKKINRVTVARERGLIFHDILSHIATPADMDDAISLTAASDENKYLTTDDLKEIRAVIESRINAPEAREWFNGFTRVLREREIATARGEIKRFDRVVWTASGEIHLIDYKTGNTSPGKYKSQIRGYIDFFKSIGYAGVRSFLYYLDTGKIIEIL